ncbi:MAG: hypothetical protein NTZ33_06275 [Bacteroidetes bacterium]|nr:hypothetical protein [Bacteroidota bacterium]
MSINKIKEMIDSLSESEFIQIKEFIIRKKTTNNPITIQELINDKNFDFSVRVKKLLNFAIKDYKYVAELNFRDLRSKRYDNIGVKTLLELAGELRDKNMHEYYCNY